VTGERVQGRVFGEVADRYDRVRPDYPAALVDDVIAYAGPGRAAVEIGAGTGKAAVAFAERGVDLTAVEPDPAMAEVLRRRLAGHPNATVEVFTFEEFAPRRTYGLLYSAQAWHWTDPATRWRRAADLLVPGGALALFWNDDRIADLDVRAAVLAAHREHAPDVPLDDGPDEEPGTAADHMAYWPGTELMALPDFDERTVREYAWRRTLAVEDYVAYLSTQSSYRMLDVEARRRLFDAVRSVATEVPSTMTTVLYLSRRR